MAIRSAARRIDTFSAVTPLWRYRWLRVLLIAVPGITAAAGILTAMESNLALVVALNTAAGVIISSVLFIAVSIFARRVADERLELTRATEQEIWRARAVRFSIHHDDTGLYADWYFRLRVQEELERSKRYSVHFSLLVLRPLGLHVDAELMSAAGWFAEHIQRHLRRSDLPALLQDGSLAIIMPNTSRRAATLVQQRVTNELAPIEPQSGLACYPGDGEEITGLLDCALHRSLEHPSNDSPPSAKRAASTPRRRAARTAG